MPTATKKPATTKKPAAPKKAAAPKAPAVDPALRIHELTEAIRHGGMSANEEEALRRELAALQG